MAKVQGRRQSIRRAMILISFLLFPVVMNYLSPYVIIDGASQGIVSGSLIVFGAQFISALFVGRLWCGWLCPTGGLQESCFAINDRRVRGRWVDWIKWFIWVPWVVLIAVLVVKAGGYRQVSFFHLTESGISVDGSEDRPIFFAYAIYYIVIGLFLILSLLVGKKAACHTICWMAPFMIIGRKVRNLFRWPALRLKADADKCTDCQRCTKACPMSLDVNRMVRDGVMENSECVLCGSCIDSCPQDVIRYSFSAGT